MEQTSPIPDDDSRWDLMFRELRASISLSSLAHPAARIWKETDLKAQITEIKKQHRAQLTTTFASATQVIQRMQSIGWLQPISVDAPQEGKTIPPLYLVDMEASPDEMIEPWELLQGYQTDGVICYFGALALHGLTTQQPSFYHIAALRKSKEHPVIHLKEPTAKYGGPKDQTRDPLGQKIFDYQGIPCYLTRPEASHMLGIQTREYGPRTLIRITTPEQTMLDALWQPLKCGGQAVAYEAWERGVLRWNEERMAQHLAKINRQDWERRVGAMLSLLGVTPESESLRKILESRKQHVANSSDIIHLPLLNNMPSSTLLPEWGILVP
jgi:hypothetical protein